MQIANIDGDGIIYAAGFSAQKNHYWVDVFKLEEGLLLDDPQSEYYIETIPTDWENKTVANKFIKEHQEEYRQKGQYLFLDWQVEIAPLEFVLGNTKAIINSIMTETKSDVCRIFLSKPGGKSFRKLLTNTYKQSRKDQLKPVYYDEVHHYLTKHQKAVWSRDYYETDDEVAIEHMRCKDMSVLCSMDKDLRMIPGWNYNFYPEKRSLTWISEYDAMKHFWSQMVIGDNADDIVGIRGLGEKKVAKLFHEQDLDWIENKVKELYQKDHGAAWENMFNLNRQLLWIHRSEDELQAIPIKELENA